MRENKPDQIQLIVDKVFPQLVAGEITLESVLAAHPKQAEELRIYLENALWISSQHSKYDPRPDFLVGGKKRLISLLKVQQPKTIWQRLWRPHSPQRLAIQSLSFALLVVSLFLVINTLILASRLALPGDRLYPTKLTIENIQLVLTYNPQERARLQIERTQHRTTEIVQLVLEDNLTYLPETVARLEVQISDAMIDLDLAKEDNTTEAQMLVEAMDNMLENETFILTILCDMKPLIASMGLNQAISATTAGLIALQN